MALAILELLAFEGRNFRFRIDTGTNRYYHLKIGRNIRRRNGLDWLGDIYHTTPVEVNQAGGGLMNSAKEVSLPITNFDRGKAYVQLFSYKTPQGKSPAFSQVVKVHAGTGIPVQEPVDFGISFSVPTAMNTIHSFQKPRTVACRTYREAYAQQASVGDLLGGILKVAGPIVQQLLSSSGQNTGEPNGASSGAGANGAASQTNLLSVLLNALMGSLSGGGQPLSQQSSLLDPDVQDNRFLVQPEIQYAQPFFWQAILQAAAGELIKIAPQLMNSANQRRVQEKQASNKLITDILSQVNQRMLMERLMQAQREQTPGSQTPDMTQLIALLQQAPAAETAEPPAAQTQPAAITQSLAMSTHEPAALSSKAIVSFIHAEPLSWNGEQKTLFARNQAIQLKIRLDTTGPAPKTPLPKAILKFIFKDATNQMELYEKKFKQKNIMANEALVLDFSTEELARLPANKPVTVFAELRWISPKSGQKYKALGSTEIVLVNNVFLKEQGSQVSDERELVDMNRFRPFWNKIWEAPLLDSGGKKTSGKKKLLWELNANTKYSVLLTADHDANGLMETKISSSSDGLDSVSERIEGRMKAGIELSISELNKLLSLWDGETPLERERLEAFNTCKLAKLNASEFVTNLKLKGRAAERGMIWVAPVFKLFDFTLNTVQRTDETAQVVEVSEERARFPLPVAARLIGLKTGNQDPPEEDGYSENGDPEYHFEGYVVEFSEKIMLTRLAEGQNAPVKMRAVA